MQQTAEGGYFMIIHIGKNEYRINNSFVSSSKNLLLRILRKVKEESNIRGVTLRSIV